MSETFVYIAAEDEISTPVKVGVSSNPIRRIRRLNTAWPGRKRLTPIYFVRCESREHALIVESSTLARLKNQGVEIRRQELAYCQAHTAVGCLQLTWQQAYEQVFNRVQMELFGEAA